MNKTNYEYLISANKSEMAAVIASLVANVIETLTGKLISDFEVVAYADICYNWLEEDLVQGDYLN